MPNVMRQTVEFWPGKRAQIDTRALAESAVPVKGVSYHSPLRFLEIYANTACGPELSWREIETTFWPRIPGVNVVLGTDVPQPPFAWRDADPKHIAVSFTYNTNAFFRILSALSDQGLISATEIDSVLDEACVLLTRLYKARDHFLIRNINNNFNMFLISKVVEFIVGKRRYNADRQELRSVRKSLDLTLSLASHYSGHSIVEKMGLAVGSGVSFIESRMRDEKCEARDINDIEETFYQYHQPMAIDHRSKLLQMIDQAGLKKDSFTLAVILDDATESVVDLLWLQDLMEQFAFFKANLLVNTAQISINFSSHLLNQIWRAAEFNSLVSKLNSQFFLTEIYCPFISFQTSFLPAKARRVIQQSDAVYVKGANFFETCQILDKETFHAFVVYGAVSRSYTGLQNFDGVFAHVGAGMEGYSHRDSTAGGVVRLCDMVENPPLSPIDNTH